MKESITKFDLESAFKALGEIEIPEVGRVRANKPALTEIFSRKSKFDALMEEYYDIGSSEGLEDAKEAREAEVAQAKLARIEKIVDLDAESAEDLLTSYVGKYIIQCPQCMTLFYKNPEDVVASEEDPSTVNLSEVCQHCGNESGYSLIGKVGEAESETAEEPAAEEDNLELNLDDASMEDPAEESTEDDLNFDDELEEFDLEIEDEAAAEEDGDEEDDEKKEESLNQETAGKNLTESSEVDLPVQECERSEDNLAENKEVALVEELANDKELDAKLEAHTEYIEYLRNMIAQEENALEKTENSQVKDAIQRRIDAFKADLEAALPEAVKNDTAIEEPTKEVEGTEVKTEPEATEDAKNPEDIKESLTEALHEDTEVSDEEFEQLMNSSEFKKPISDTAVRAMLNAETDEHVEAAVEESVSTYQCADCGYEVELDNADYDGMCPNCKEHHGFYQLEENIDNIFSNIEELQEAALESMISDSLVELYGNVAGFRLKDCSYEDNSFMVEGIIHFSSGNTRKTTYIFNEALVEADKITLRGLNEKLGNDKQFFITGYTENKTFITESFKTAKN